jgi:hypothetical protein
VLGELVEFVNEVRQVRQPEAAFNDKQVENITQRLLGSTQAWTKRFVRTSYLRSVAVLLVALLGALGLGIGVGWWVFAPPSQLACADQTDGSRLCWMYTRLPAGHK